MIRIDFFQTADKDELYQLFTEWDKNHRFDYDLFQDSLNKVSTDPNSKILIAREDDQIVGYVQIYKCNLIGFETFYEVAQLLVAEEKRNQGIGKKIMQRVEEIALSENITTLKLSSQVHRTRAHLFYEELGYVYYKVSKFYQKKI